MKTEQTATAISQVAKDLLSTYQPPSGPYDELLAPDGSVRPHWQDALAGIGGLSPDAQNQAVDHAVSVLRDNDVSYQSQGTGPIGRPWRFDLLPFVMSSADYEQLAQGLSQRARLLNAIVADCLGPQELVASGLLPPAIVFGNNSFLPACHGIKPPGNRYFSLAGFEVARAPNGQWWVIRNRVSRPAGLGYALESRILSSQCLPDVFENTSVQRVASFFRSFSSGLQTIADSDNPLNLILTAQQRDNDYFDHAFLGRYLGHSVVTGGDLTVREDRVYLKTVRGLQPVDLLVRRIDTVDCDPLELDFKSIDGVPGLMQTVRRGRVAMVNGPGSEIADDPSLNSFLPKLCQHLLGEELRLPSVASWWCGQPKEQQYVLNNLDGLVIRRLQTINRARGHSRHHFVGADLTPQSRQQLAELIRQFPSEFVAREPMAVSVAPAWNPAGELVAARTSLRMFLSASPDGYYLMPGGLARADASHQDSHPSMRLPNDLNKDIWVKRTTETTAVEAASLLPTRIALKRSDRNLASRTADNLFWLGAYMERAESSGRLFRSLIDQLTGDSAYGQQVAALDRLVAVLVAQGQLSSRRAKRILSKGRHSFTYELSSIIFDQENSEGLNQIVRNIARNADLVRDRLSPDMWRLLERLEASITTNENTSAARTDRYAIVRHLNALLDTMAALNGMIETNMTRADGWRFLSCGRDLERIRQRARLFDELTSRPATPEQGSLNLLLEVSDCAITYRTRYGSAPQFEPVADLILADETNPRSLLSHVAALRTLINQLPDTRHESNAREADKTLLKLDASLRLIDCDQLDRRSRAGARRSVTRLCDQALTTTNFITTYLTDHYFSHVGAVRISGYTSPV